ncbi:MAG TPA: hypothetical protein PKA27_00750 [Fimbriimonadaceae bacterium]|nr:hypothetical protein [Fimbriimonadaceae bacterium]
MKIANITIVGLAAIVAVGCGSKSKGTYQATAAKKVEPAKVTPGNEAELFPTKEGSQWVYETEQVTSQGTQVGEVIFKAVKVIPTGDGNKVQFEMENGGKVIDRQTWLINSKGIFQLTSGPQQIPFDPPQPVLLFPAEQGRTFSWQGKGVTSGGQIGTSTIKSTIMGPQEIDTGTGAMSGIAVQQTSEGKVGNQAFKTASMVWFVPKVGLARYKQQVAAGTITLRLKNFTSK